MFIILDGFVKAHSISSAGEELTVSFFCKGDIVPLPWVFDTSTTALFYYSAASNVRVLSVSKNDFCAQLHSNAQYINDMLAFQNKHYTSLLLRITGLQQSRAVDKLAYTFYYLMFRYGSEKTPDTFFIDMKLSQSIIANLVGITRESTTRNLALLKAKGVISYQNSKYTIYKKKLENFIGEDGFQELSL